MRKIGKFTTGYIPRGGYINPKRVPFQEILPLGLRNVVSGKGDKSTSSVCIQEMSLLFSCLKKHDFKESACASEISKFQTCYSEFKQSAEAKKIQERKGLLVPGEKKLSHRQANELLRRYPS